MQKHGFFVCLTGLITGCSQAVTPPAKPTLPAPQVVTPAPAPSPVYLKPGTDHVYEIRTTPAPPSPEEAAEERRQARLNDLQAKMSDLDAQMDTTEELMSQYGEARNKCIMRHDRQGVKVMEEKVKGYWLQEQALARQKSILWAEFCKVRDGQ